MKTKTVDITPDVSLLPKLGYAGYSFTQALSEFIDNAIDASDNEKPVHVRISLSPDKIVVYDSGPGMTQDELAHAMTLAYSTKKHQIGRFGMGMKTAALSLGTTFRVTTTSEKDNTYNTVCFDEQAWFRNDRKDWSIRLKNKPAVTGTASFTRITITHLKNTSFKSLQKLASDLSLRYAPFIRANRLNLWINNKKCIFPRQKTVKGSKTQINIPMKQHSSLLTPFDQKDIITGWYALTQDTQKSGYYGFNLYWHNRLIAEYDKIGIGENISNSRIIGEFHLDFLPVTHNKREFIKESDEYTITERVLTDAFGDLVAAADMLSNQEKIKQALTTETSTWLTTLAKAFTKSQQLRELTMLSDIGVPTGTLDESGNEPAKADANIPDKQPSPRDTTTPKQPADREEPKKTGKKTNKRKDRFKITIKGKRFEFTHKFVSLGPRGPWKQHAVNTETGIVEIFTNTDFPAFKATHDKSFYAVLHIVDALAAVFVDSVGEKEYSFEDIREIIMRETCSMALDSRLTNDRT